MKHDFTHETIESLLSRARGNNIMGLLWGFT